MSIDRTLHIRSGGRQKRNVLKRPERIAILAAEDEFDNENGSPLGLRKTRVRASKAGSKRKKAEAPAEGAEGAEGAEAAEPEAADKG